MKFYRDNTFDIDGSFIVVYIYDLMKPNAISAIAKVIT